MKKLLFFLLYFIPLLLMAGGATLVWNPNTESDLAGYNVYYGTSSRVYTNRVNVGNVTTNAVSNLVVGVTYYFAVTAYNTAGAESDYSLEVSYKVPNPAPSIPTGLRVVSVTNAFKIP